MAKTANFQTWESYNKFEHHVLRGSRYILDEESREFLDTLVANAEERIGDLREGTILCRAQRGHAWRDHQITDPDDEGKVIETIKVPAPFGHDRMKPPIDKAKEGRANPKGIPCLYLANDRETAMSEVRPWIGAMISLALFKTTKKLRLVNLSLHHDLDVSAFSFIYFGDPPPGDPKKVSEFVWKSVDRAFSAPVTLGDDTAEYAPTQIIAERFKSEGYDGIYFRTALREKGYNVALFDLDSAKSFRLELHEVKRVQFEFEEKGW